MLCFMCSTENAFDGILSPSRWDPRLINKLHIIMHRPIKCVSNIQHVATTTFRELLQIGRQGYKNIFQISLGIKTQYSHTATKTSVTHAHYSKFQQHHFLLK